MKKFFLVLLTVLIAAIGLTGCGKKGKDPSSSEKTQQSKEYVYRMEELNISEEEFGSVTMLRSGERFLAYEYIWPEDGDSYSINFSEVSEDGKRSPLFQLDGEPNGGYNGIVADADNMYMIKNIYYYDGVIDEETGETIEEGEYHDEYYLVKLSLSGEEIFSVNLSDIPELKALEEQNGYMNAYGMFLADNSIYVSCVGVYVRFDKEGNFQKLMGTPGEDNDFNNANFIPLLDGRVAAMIYEENGAAIALADMEKGSIGEKHTLSGAFSYSYYPGIGYDLYVTDNYGMYGYNIGDEALTPLLNFVDSDFAFWGISNVLAINEKEFYGYYDSIMDGGSNLAKFIKVDPSEVKEKTILTLAMAYTDWAVRSEVIQFNKTNEEYRISIQDYASMYATEEDYNAGVTRLNTDIVSGKIPDMLLLDSSMPVDSYINKGLFEDLKPYIEKDSELDMDNFMPNIIEMCSKDGKMYILMPSFSIQTLVAKTSEVGAERGWTVQEAMDLWDSKPEGTEFLNGMTKENMLRESLNYASSQFIDWESGKCNFNSEDFVKMLEFSNRFPEEIDDDYYTDDYWENYDSQWRTGKVIASQSYIGDFRNYNNVKKSLFGEEVTMIGFPSSDGDGSVVMPGLQLTMSSKSANKDGVWEFLRTFLTDEYQSDIYGFKISIKHMEKMAQEATKKPYYEDENGNKVEYDDTTYIDGVEIVIDPMTQQEADEFLEQIYTFRQMYRFDEALNEIIEEEAAAYFSGQKSAKDVAGVIQSRVQIYVNETR